MFAIRTKRLILRDLAMRDVPRLNEFFTDRVVTREMGFVRTRNLRETRAWVKRAICHNRKRPRHAYSLTVVTRKDRKIVGWIGFGDADKNKRHIGERDFGFAFRQECWGMGYGTESLRGITDFIFRKLKGRSFFGDHDVKNPASGRVMQKCGFRRLPRRVRGAYATSRVWLLTRESWLKLRRAD